MITLLVMTDQIQSINSDLWGYCVNKDSKSPPPFILAEIESDLKYFLENILHITKDEISHSNCKNVSITLVNELEKLLN